MLDLTLENISIENLNHTSGVFMGKKNKLKKFRSQQVINEVVGALSGNENSVQNNYWINNKPNGEDE